MIIFENDGLIDIRGITTFGLNAKENDNPIGHFGTGLKYAIAIVLRLGGNIIIYRGRKKYAFTVKEQKVRGKKVPFVLMNGKHAGFTLELGKGWAPWQAFRELYCNTLDEGGQVGSAASAESQAGRTVVVVTNCPEIDQAFEDRNTIVLSPDRIPFSTASGIEAYSAPTRSVFYRGIRVFEIDGRVDPFPWTFNITRAIELTEDRTVKWEFQIWQRIADWVGQIEDHEIMERILILHDRSPFKKVDFAYTSAAPNDLFRSTVHRLSRDKSTPINESAKQYVAPEDKADFEPYTLNPVEDQQYTRALGFLTRLGWTIDASKVEFAEYLGTQVLGMAKGGRIIIAKEAFSMGTKMVAGTLLEEHLHVDKGLDDESRGMQNHLLNELMSMGERVLGQSL